MLFILQKFNNIAHRPTTTNTFSRFGVVYHDSIVGSYMVLFSDSYLLKSSDLYLISYKISLQMNHLVSLCIISLFSICFRIPYTRYSLTPCSVENNNRVKLSKMILSLT